MMLWRSISSTPVVQAGVRASGMIGTMLCIMSGKLTAHCSACMPPMDAPTTVTSLPMPNFSVTRRCCEFTMSRILKRGNCMRGCILLLEGDVVSPLPIASVAMMKYLDGSNARPGPIR